MDKSLNVRWLFLTFSFSLHVSIVILFGHWLNMNTSSLKIYRAWNFQNITLIFFQLNTQNSQPQQQRTKKKHNYFINGKRANLFQVKTYTRL